MVTTSQHDSAAGWSNLLTPNVAWRFNRHFSVNSETPVYTYINVSVATGFTRTAGIITGTQYTLETKNWQYGDTSIAGQFEAHPKIFDYNVTATLGAPTGNYIYGLGAGKYTYSVVNHFEHAFFDFLDPDIELGIGDASNLINSRVRQSYVAVGQQAHFQAGLSVWLPWDIGFTSDAYEELPLSTQTVTSETLKGKKGKLKIVKTSAQKSIGEDNGFLNTLDIPLNGHITLSGFYNRSLRNHDDTAGFSFTFLLRKTPRAVEKIH